MPISEMPLVERVARVLAARRLLKRLMGPRCQSATSSADAHYVLKQEE